MDKQENVVPIAKAWEEFLHLSVWNRRQKEIFHETSHYSWENTNIGFIE